VNTLFTSAFAGIVLAPLVGGLVKGVDRKLTARFQSRVGPPVFQPFYDVLKLAMKEHLVVNVWQVLCAYVFMAAAGISVALFFLQSDLLLILFVHGVSSVFLVIGAICANSPYSQIGAHRELLQILTYKPLLVLVVFGIYLQTGSFKIDSIHSLDRPLLLKLPVLFLVLGCALTIELRKSPFDLSASHHAHQEIVRGVLTEYSGPSLAFIEIGHWYEIVLLLGVCSLFWADSLLGKTLLVTIVYFLQIVTDNVSARLTWRWMLTYALGVGLILAVLNLIWLMP
jgi:ech hydrogenase subunit B